MKTSNLMSRWFLLLQFYKIVIALYESLQTFKHDYMTILELLFFCSIETIQFLLTMFS